MSDTPRFILRKGAAGMFFVHDNRDDRAVCLVFRHGRDATKTEAMAEAIRDALNAAVSRPRTKE
ncbi:MAG: hypothetical protein IJU37_13315 [Desulfovibrio sp.]|nr:hypothetical protein [Desulfovibrio sp.]